MEQRSWTHPSSVSLSSRLQSAEKDERRTKQGGVNLLEDIESNKECEVPTLGVLSISNTILLADENNSHVSITSHGMVGQTSDDRGELGPTTRNGRIHWAVEVIRDDEVL